MRELLDPAPHTATVERDARQIEVRAAEVRVGDVVVLEPGDEVSLDGRVIDGSSSVDDTIVTGECLPVEKVLTSRSSQARSTRLRFAWVHNHRRSADRERLTSSRSGAHRHAEHPNPGAEIPARTSRQDGNRVAPIQP